ncbi:MAG: esterase/lipase family protein [Candidatus Binataceae bacterium]
MSISEVGGSVLREIRIWGEMASLLIDPVFYGAAMPRGDGRLAVVIPGLFGNDLYLLPLRSFLHRIGYRPVRSSLFMNAGCPQRLREQIEREIDRNSKDAAERVVVIGHSRGGLLARAIAGDLQERVSHLVTLGAPMGVVPMVATDGWDAAINSAVRARPVLGLSLAARLVTDRNCAFPQCDCAFPKAVTRALNPRTAMLSIFTPDDPIVAATACRTDEGANFEVGGSHSGLAFNRRVYRELAHFLSREHEASPAAR